MANNNINLNNLENVNYPVDKQSQVPSEFRSSNVNTIMPPHQPNGGLYGGPECLKPWMPIPITPTTTNLIQNNLRSANPPPGATEQYVGYIRKGNNYTSMPGVYWYNKTPSLNPGPYNIKGI
jgi:hypothetical protein